MSRILVSGMLSGVPRQGSAVWATLQYVLGFASLGHDVLLVEPISHTGLVPEGKSLSRSANAAYFRKVVADFGIQGSAALLLQGARETVGLPYAELRREAIDTDIVINLSGLLTEPELLDPAPIRVYLDLDPAFTQLWQTVQGIDMGFEGHTHFVTIGKGVGHPDCSVPTCGLDWITSLQPLVLSRWPMGEVIVRDAFTTIANWRGYGSIDHAGVLYGQKAHSLRPFLSLPLQTDESFLLALAIHPDERADLEALKANHWQLVDPGTVAGSPQRAREFISGSKAEFCIAKSGYVASRCGWFSHRSICYLAAGRPVIAQDTGFAQFLPTGNGLFSFEQIDEALDAIEAINADYPFHRRGARALAEEYFDAGKVLTRLLGKIGATP